MRIVSNKQMQMIESIAMNQYKIPSAILMENAVLAATALCERHISKEGMAVVVAGPGKNGGDGFGVARQLTCRGYNVAVLYIGDITEVSGDSLTNLDILHEMGVNVEPIPNNDSYFNIVLALTQADLVVDAIFGTGLSRSLEGSFEDMVETINTYGKYIISLDLPSGIDGDTGQVLGCAVKAHQTITFGAPKIGLYLHPGCTYAGEISVANISIPKQAYDAVEVETEIMDEHDAHMLLPMRKPRANKGDFGRAYIFAGCNDMPGAALLATRAFYKSGGGLACACVVPYVSDVIHTGSAEAITRVLPEKSGFLCAKSFDYIRPELERADVIIIGPGLGRNENVVDFVRQVIVEIDVPMVIDADALNVIAMDLNLLRGLKKQCVITPHPGEMSRLTSLEIQEVLDNTVSTATEFAKEFGVVTLLKDARTVVASPSGEVYINTSGSNALSKAGTGDVLTGVIAALIAQGADIYTAAKLGAYIHGKAGELAAERVGVYGVMATDVINCISEIMASLQ